MIENKKLRTLVLNSSQQNNWLIVLMIATARLLRCFNGVQVFIETFKQTQKSDHLWCIIERWYLSQRRDITLKRFSSCNRHVSSSSCFSSLSFASLSAPVSLAACISMQSMLYVIGQTVQILILISFLKRTLWSLHSF